MDILKIENHRDYINKSVDGWNVISIADNFNYYAITLEKESNNVVFTIPKVKIKGFDLRLDYDVYELRYEDCQHSIILSLSEILDKDLVISKIGELIKQYE